MKKIFLLLIPLLFLSCKDKELSPRANFLKSNAIPIKYLSSLSKKVYESVQPYEVILIGEMHGTKEPSQFAFSLSKLIADIEGKVILCLEIPPSQMESYTSESTLEELKALNFFKGENTSGMNGEAWINLIDNSNRNDNIHIKFIDTQKFSPRDSAMYTSVVDLKIRYPDTKIISLTGNLHNWLIPRKNKKMLGNYLVNDSINFDRTKIMSINHIFSEGTMLNRMGNGLELRKIERKSTIYNSTISAKNYLTKAIDKDEERYTHMLYTDKVTHSKVLDQ